MDQQLATPLSTVLNRIATGIVFGATLISMFFTIWAIIVQGGGPAIGVLVFQIIALIASIFLSIKIIWNLHKDAEPALEFVQV